MLCLYSSSRRLRAITSRRRYHVVTNRFVADGEANRGRRPSSRCAASPSAVNRRRGMARTNSGDNDRSHPRGRVSRSKAGKEESRERFFSRNYRYPGVSDGVLLYDGDVTVWQFVRSSETENQFPAAQPPYASRLCAFRRIGAPLHRATLAPVRPLVSSARESGLLEIVNSLYKFRSLLADTTVNRPKRPPIRTYTFITRETRMINPLPLATDSEG